MRTLCFVVALLLSRICKAQNELLHELPHSNASTLQSTYLNEYRLVMTVFYTTWCSHCKNMLPSLVKANNRISMKDMSVKIVMIDMQLEENMMLLKTYPIYGYPSMLLFKDGKFAEGYSGSRTEKGIWSYLSGYFSTLENESETWLPSPEVDSVTSLEHIIRLARRRGEENRKKGYILGLAVFMPTQSASSSAVNQFSVHSTYNNESESSSPLHSLLLSGRLNSFISTDALNCEYTITTAWTCSSDIISRYAVEEDSVLVFTTSAFPNEEMNPISSAPLSQHHSVEDISEFLQSFARPSIITYSPSNLAAITASPNKVHVLLFMDINSTRLDIQRQSGLEAEIGLGEGAYLVVEAVAKKYRNKFLFVQISSIDYQITQIFGYARHDFPQIVIADLRDKRDLKKYEMPIVDPIISRDKVEQFLIRFLDGSLPRAFKSDSLNFTTFSPPKTLPSSIVGHNFHQYVTDTAYDAFIYFHAPWCAFCKAFEPVFDGLFSYYMNDENILVSKIDSITNDVLVPGLHINALPTFYFFKASNKSDPIEYKGERSVDAIVNFIEELRDTSSLLDQEVFEDAEDSALMSADTLVEIEIPVI